MIKKFTTIFLLLFIIKGCTQDKPNTQPMQKNNVDSLELSISDKIQKFDKRPYYTLQINKMNCRALVRINDLPLAWNFFEDDGETLLIPINSLIPASGKQSISIEIYPLSNQEILNSTAYVNAKLFYAPDRNTPMNEFKTIEEISVPDLTNQKLTEYQLKGSFQADVSHNFSKELETAQDLSKIPNIENKILQKYKQLGKLIENGDSYNFLHEMENFYIKHWSYNYFTKEEIQSDPESESSLYDLSLPGRELAPLENYEIIFYHNNKVAILRDKKDKSFHPKIYFWLNEEEKNAKKEKVFANRFITLYMPQGSNELKVY